MTVRLFRTTRGAVLETEGHRWLLADLAWDELFRGKDPSDWLTDPLRNAVPFEPAAGGAFLPPIGSQEVWAAGVTYYRSRSARMEEAASAGGGDFYDRVYSAPRPELFFKAIGWRVQGHTMPIHVRADSHWNVPEPELTLCVSSAGRIFGYTIGNDMSSRDIEGENPLYLPQAKVYDGSCALGPCILMAETTLPATTEIAMSIRRGGEVVFAGSTHLEQMKRTPQELVEYLFRYNSFPAGCFLLTGTGIVPPGDFTLQPGDEVSIAIEPIGTLVNSVMQEL